MGIKGTVFIVIAILGAILNFSSRRISDKTGFSELKIKLAALVTVIIFISLLMIFGK